MIDLPLACPVCSWNAALPVWAVFALLRLTVIVFIARRSLDWVRVILAFGLLELSLYWLTREFMWYSHPAIEGSDAWRFVSPILLLHISGILPALMLKLASNARPFRVRSAGLTWRQSLSVIPVWLILFACQVVWIDARSKHL